MVVSKGARGPLRRAREGEYEGAKTKQEGKMVGCSHNARGLPRFSLPDHTLRDVSWLKGIVETEIANVRVRANALDAGQILHLL